jgi:hypothetical protein
VIVGDKNPALTAMAGFGRHTLANGLKYAVISITPNSPVAASLKD